MYINDELIDRVDSTMGDLVDNIIKLDMDEIEGYDFPLDEAFGLQVIYHDELYCFIIRLSSTNKNFICMGPGAHPRDKRTAEGKLITPPFFVRWRWYNYFEESIIAYADPVMFHKDDINLAWFTGNRQHWPLEDVASIIEKLAVNQKVINDNIMFFGSSGGGFSSVMLATLIKGSKALVNNAQLYVLNYYKTHVEKLFEMLQEEFDGLSREEIIDEINYRLNLIELIKRENYAPPITYYANIKSCNDINSQVAPFILEYHNLDYPNTLNIIYYHDPDVDKAHNPIPTPETIEIINVFSQNYLFNDDEYIKDHEADVIDKGKYVDKLNEEIAGLNKENNDLNKQNVRLNKLNRGYMSQINNLNNANVQLNSNVNFLRNTNNKLKNEIETRKIAFKKKDSRTRWLEKQYSHFMSTKAYKIWQKYANFKKKLK